MPFSVSIDAVQPYLALTAAGPATLAELCGLTAMVAELVTRQSHRLVLADLSGVVPELSFTDHLQFGAQASRLLARLARLAVVVPPAYMDAPAAKAAQLAGLHVRTFLTRADAAAWIEASDGGTATPPAGRWTLPKRESASDRTAGN